MPFVEVENHHLVNFWIRKKGRRSSQVLYILSNYTNLGTWTFIYPTYSGFVVNLQLYGWSNRTHAPFFMPIITPESSTTCPKCIFVDNEIKNMLNRHFIVIRMQNSLLLESRDYSYALIEQINLFINYLISIYYEKETYIFQMVHNIISNYAIIRNRCLF